MIPQETLTELLIGHQYLFHPVVPYLPGSDKLLLMNFTADNTALTDNVLENIELFSAYVEKQLIEAGTRYGIGGYNEHRTVYRVSKVFDGDKKGEEPRRLHLGVDIWGRAGTPVMAPMDGTVHSFAFNDRFGDYGATIILLHQLKEITFFSLYGHLSLSSLDTIEEGKKIKKGQLFAFFGTPEENGHWPPHLHFQLIHQMAGWKGDYPGVCKFSEKEKYILNCPDPNLILQMTPTHR